jgi:DNA replication protein
MFKGFPEGKIQLTRLPSQLIQELLPDMHHLDELRLVLYFFWRIEYQEGVFRFLNRKDFLEDDQFISSLDPQFGDSNKTLDDALSRAVQRGILLQAVFTKDDQPETIFFINSARGRAAIQAIKQGKWNPGKTVIASVEEIGLEKNIFSLYEQNIGPLTPIISDTLRDAEATYPAIWIEDAFKIAVENNKRNWKYIQAILKRWQEEGRDERTDRRDSEKDGRRYIEGEYADFIEH